MRYNLYIQGKLSGTCLGWKSIYDMVMEQVYHSPHPDSITEEQHMNCAEAEAWGELSAYQDGDEYEVDDFKIIAYEE